MPICLRLTSAGGVEAPGAQALKPWRSPDGDDGRYAVSARGVHVAGDAYEVVEGAAVLDGAAEVLDGQHVLDLSLIHILSFSMLSEE